MPTEMQDVLVIGSGFGGSIAASRLVDAGVFVAQQFVDSAGQPPMPVQEMLTDAS